MPNKKVAVFGIYSTRIAVELATDALNTAGFPGSDISVLMSKSFDGSNDMGTEPDPMAPEGTVAAVTSALVGMGLPEYEARRYEGRLQKNGILLTVHCDTPGEIMRAKEVVQGTGGEHISSSGESMVETMKTPAVAAGR